MPSPRFKVYESNRADDSPDGSIGWEASCDQLLTKDNSQKVSLESKLIEHYLLRKVADRLKALISIKPQRGLAAVMYADVADYSRLMRQNSEKLKFGTAAFPVTRKVSHHEQVPG